MNASRSYTMRARAAAVEETRRRILDATFGLAQDQPIAAISLETVARTARVSVQTVLRHFGSRSGLIEATADHAAALVAAERRAPGGDVAEGMRLLLDHYEKRGDATLLLLAQEGTDPLLRRVLDRGRQVHRTWVEQTFAHALAPLGEEERETRTDLLAVATDVYTWKLLRRDRKLSRAATQDRMTVLVTSLLEKGS